MLKVELREETKLLMLRSSATTHYWSAAQVRQLVVLITFKRRVDAVVMLFRRIVDLDQFYKEVQGMGGGRWDTSALIARLTR